MITCDPDKISFSIAEDGNSITFHPCGVTSHHKRDVAEMYCPACHRFMSLLDLAQQLKREFGFE